MDTKKLRQKILDLAIRGKLVPQDPNDEPASVLLERIKAEKEQLIKEGKIKRSKQSVSSDTFPYENVPFEIPESWAWTTIGELLINRDNERIPLSLAVRKQQSNKQYDYYGAAGVIDKVSDYLFSEKLLLIGEDGANLLSRSKNNAFFADGKYWVNNHAHVLDCTLKQILTYVAFVINSMSLEPYITGSAQPKLSQDNLNRIPIPLPPLAEQNNIICSTEKWFTFIEELEKEKSSLQEIIKYIKAKILDLAIHGKLVPQKPNDEPAIELLRRINPDFQPCDNAHYDILPDGWYLSNYENAFYDISSKPYQILQSQIKAKGLYPVISQSSNYVEGYSDANCFIDNDNPCIIFGDHTRIVKYVDFKFIVGADGVKIIYPYTFPRFAYYLILYASNNIDNKGYSRHFAQIKKFHYAIPPINEQLRIVAKIEELFATLDKIKESLEV